MYKYIQRDATVSWLLFQELYMFLAFTMPIIRSNITATAAYAVMLHGHTERVIIRSHPLNRTPLG
jgi:hypothetical protein